MPAYKNHKEKIELIKKGELHLKDNVGYFLSMIGENKKLNAFNFIFDEAGLMM